MRRRKWINNSNSKIKVNKKIRKIKMINRENISKNSNSGREIIL